MEYFMKFGFLVTLFFGLSAAVHSAPMGHNHQHSDHQHNDQKKRQVEGELQAKDMMQLQDVRVREFIPGTASSAGFFKLKNLKSSNLTIAAVEIEHIGRVEIHTHEQKNGVMKMMKLDKLIVAAGETVHFQPGGLHLMLFEPTPEFKKLKQAKLTLITACGKKLTSQAKIVSILKETDHAHHH